MAYENIDFKYNNFCIAPITNTFASIDTTNATSVLQIRNTSGVVQANYDLNPTLTQDLSVDALVYTGPVGTSALGDGMPFFTLEHISSSSCRVRRWELNDTYNRLDLVKTLNINSTGNYYFDCYSMAVEHYTTSFDSAEAPGTGTITVDDTTRMAIGESLYLGPSSHTNNVNAFEEVSITAISGSTISILPTASGASAPDNYYDAGDPITYYKDILLFSDIGLNNNTSAGTLFRIEEDSGLVLDTHTSGLYKAVRASCYGIPYFNTVGFVRNANLLYVDIDDFEVKKSAVLPNVKADDQTVITAHDLEFTSNTMYVLQDEITLRDDNGNKANYSWANYNYHQGSTIPYVDNITMWFAPCGMLSNEEQTTVYALVRDQYGNALNNITVDFDKVSGDAGGGYDDINKQDVTGIDGIASLTYTCGWSDPGIADVCCEDIILTSEASGASTFTGSQYVWAVVELILKKKYILETYSKEIIQKWDGVTGTMPLIQKEQVESELIAPSWSKFWFPGGHGDSPSGNLQLITQLNTFESYVLFEQWENFDATVGIEQKGSQQNTLQQSQTYISRHMDHGHQDDVTVNQFRFLLDALPEFWSEKNALDTDIWIKLAPFGFDLDQATLIFEVREVSYAGDTGYIDYANTPYIVVETFDAGGGLLGLEITVDPPADFHANAVVYVKLSVDDNATPKNTIVLDYWFRIMPDFKAPFITNEQPGREALDVQVDTDISFDIQDLGVGVDIDTLEFYVNNRLKAPITTTISGGYHVAYNPPEDFHFGQTTDITIRVRDASIQQNFLVDTYRFHCIGSDGPWFDPQSFNPEDCKSGVYRKLGEITLNVYEINDTGLDRDSITLAVDKKSIEAVIKPILLRIE